MAINRLPRGRFFDVSMKGVSYNRVMNLDDFSTTFEDRRYINPQVSLDEQNTFIDNYRTSQGQRTEKIAQDTYNLGTAVPSNLGGLSGAGNYFTSRYQTPQTNEVIGNLKSAAQAQALNDAMSNELAKAKERYNQAYRNYQKKARRAALGGNTNPTTTNQTNLPIDTNPNSNNDGDVDVGGTNPTTHDGKTIRGVNSAEYAQNKLLFDTMKPKNGYTFTKNGRTFIYISDGSRPTGWYAVVGE